MSFVQAAEGKRTVWREIVAADRNQPGRHFVIVLFDSCESAMQHSRLPGTQAAAENTGHSPMGRVFHDLDVLEDRA
jgi:hypothetical protein